ncbi:uncharacterized protein LOC121866899, partial [Homarus americanus]|uniref:uncharacterized protein LOC121866899 n=1 Tax=Homarus americanus TaxID=6706 RepID=UPI001C484499
LLLLWTTDGSSRSTTTKESLHRGFLLDDTFINDPGASSGDDHRLGFPGKYDLDLEYPEDDLHDLGKDTRERYILSDYQRDDLRLRESQQTLYKEYLKRESYRSSAELVPRTREEREGGDYTKHTTHDKQNTSVVSGNTQLQEKVVQEEEEAPADPLDDKSSAVREESKTAGPLEEKEAGGGKVVDGDLHERMILSAGRPLCRSKEKYLPPDMYNADACALCYFHIVNRELFNTKWITLEVQKAVEEEDVTYNVSVLLNPMNFSQLVSVVSLFWRQTDRQTDRQRSCWTPSTRT